MKHAYIASTLFLFINNLFAQNQANNWYFGEAVGITFNTSPPSQLFGSALDTGEGSSSISDVNGNLLFYSDGTNVWDRNHNLMNNGTGLLGDYSSTQSAIIVPMPGSSSLFYLFTAPEYNDNSPFAYSIIDMTLNNGFGDVATKNVALVTSSSEKQTVIQHQNGIDYWIIAHDIGNNFYSYLLTNAGVSAPIISNSGNSISGYPLIGNLKGAPCGNQLVMASYANGNDTSFLALFDFNNSSGIVSNALQLGEWMVTGGVYGVEFSPDNSKLYASLLNPSMILQFNLLAGSPSAIINSMDTVGISPDNALGAMQTGPDGRIYIAQFSDDSLACITNPNLPGNSCGFIYNYIRVSPNPYGCLFGLPSFPVSYFCNIPSGINDDLQSKDLSVYPNPFINEISISVPKIDLENVTLVLRNIFGQEIFKRNYFDQSSSNSISVDLNFLSKGVYLLELNHDDERVIRKIVKQ